MIASRHRQTLWQGTHCGTGLTGAQRQAPPTQPQPPKAAQTEFVICDQAISIVAKRLNKRQQMRWSRATVQPFLDVRTAVLNDTLEDAFRHRYPGFRPANDDQALPAAA